MQCQFWRQRCVDCSEIERIRLHPEGHRRHNAHRNQIQTGNYVKCGPQENPKEFPLRLLPSKHDISAAIFSFHERSDFWDSVKLLPMIPRADEVFPWQRSSAILVRRGPDGNKPNLLAIKTFQNDCQLRRIFQNYL